jgi:hypothetical protein
MAEALKALGLTLATLPRGAVIGTADLVDVVEIVYSRNNHVMPPSIQEAAMKELALGQWNPHRFAYRFANVQKIGPIEYVKGSAWLRDVGQWLLDEVREHSRGAPEA